MELAAGDFFSLIHTSWNGYTKNAVKKSNPEHVIIIGKGYDEPRDVKQILTKVSKLAGYVKLAGNTLIVLLDWIEDKKHRKAATKFCHLIRNVDEITSPSRRIDLGRICSISDHKSTLVHQGT
ncbi:MAG: hypothetical protein U9N47_10680 [Thermodesulfobacteriota bacterium]|nr:hypothetical protein [Thermodesulfobacteriota bacterium]